MKSGKIQPRHANAQPRAFYCRALGTPRGFAQNARDTGQSVMALVLAWVLAGTLSGCDFEADALPSSAQTPPPSASAATIAKQPLTRIRVKTDRVIQRPIVAGNSATGVVQAFRKSVVAAETGGRVTRRYVEPGTQVSAGQVLLELDTSRSQIAYDRAKADAQARQVDFAQAEHELLRGKRLIERNVISQDTLDDLRFNLDRAHSGLAAAQAQLDDAARILADSKVRAPFAGTTEIVHVQKGDFLGIGAPVVTLADFSKVRVIAGITANVAEGLKLEQPARISLGSGQATQVTGTIKSIGRIADSNGTFPLELWVAVDQANVLREGMVATVQLPLSGQEEVVSVPRSALLRREGNTYVYVFNGVRQGPESRTEAEPGTAQLTKVTLGRSDANFTQVTNGVLEGDQVIVEGLFALRDGASVEALD